MSKLRLGKRAGLFQDAPEDGNGLLELKIRLSERPASVVSKLLGCV
jgi:hypothetical protein